MAKKMINETHIEGWIYEHKLEARVTGENSKNPGTPFIMGTLDVATDNAMTNIVSVHFTYVTPTTAKNQPNNTYKVLKDIVDGKTATVMGGGKENAAKVRIDSAIGLNDFYTTRDGNEELVSAKRNEGGFVHIVDTIAENENERSTFKVDMVITNVSRKEADEEKNLPEKAVVKGCIFDFRGAILPVEFVTTSPKAMDYYEGLDASAKQPVFTKLWGKQVSQTVTRTVVEESAFDEDSVRTISSTRREWVITGGAKELYTFGGEDDDLSAATLKKAMADREVYLAGVKKRQDEYRASKAQGASATTNTADSFNF